MKYIKLVFLILYLVLLSACKNDKFEYSQISFSEVSYDTIYYMNKDKSNPYLSFGAVYDNPVNCPDPDLESFLKSITQHELTGENSEVDIYDYADKWMNDYQLLEREYNAVKDTTTSDNYPASYYWNYSGKSKVKDILDNILVLETTVLSSMGGPNASKMKYYKVYDLDTKSLVCLEDIFKDDCEEELKSIILEKIVRNYRLKKEGELEDIGFFDSADIRPTDNYFIDKKGITFVFNKDEVAIFEQIVFIPFSELNDVLKTDCPIEKLLD